MFYVRDLNIMHECADAARGVESSKEHKSYRQPDTETQ